MGRTCRTYWREGECMQGVLRRWEDNTKMDLREIRGSGIGYA
jgi:hypothetical protein